MKRRFVGFLLLLAALIPARASVTLWYNGDLDNQATAVNRFDTTGLSAIPQARMFDNCTVTAPGGWLLTRIWSNDVFIDPSQLPAQADWSIRSGMNVGNGGVTLFSGTSAATAAATGRQNFGGNPEYSIIVSGLNLYLPPGTDWLNVTPYNNINSFDISINTTSGLNAIGTPPGNDQDALWWVPPATNYAHVFGGNGQTYDFSMGVACSPCTQPFPGGPSVCQDPIPEPSTAALAFIDLGVLCWCGMRRRAGRGIVAAVLLASTGLTKAAEASRACTLLTPAEIESATALKIAELKPGAAPATFGNPGTVDLCSGIAPSASVLLRIGKKSGASGREEKGIEIARKMGAQFEVKNFGSITCSTLVPPASLAAQVPFNTTCTVTKGETVAGIEVTANSRKDMVPIDKLRPLAEKIAQRM